MIQKKKENQKRLLLKHQQNIEREVINFTSLSFSLFKFMCIILDLTQQVSIKDGSVVDQVNVRIEGNLQTLTKDQIDLIEEKLDWAIDILGLNNINKR